MSGHALTTTVTAIEGGGDYRRNEVRRRRRAGDETVQAWQSVVTGVETVLRDAGGAGCCCSGS